MSLKNAVALVTGASGGLGAHICAALAVEGAHVAIGYRTGEDRAREIANTVAAAGVRAHLVQIDHADPASVDAAIADVTGTLGGLDLLVNNAGMAGGGHGLAPKDIEGFTPEIWDEMMAVNVRGPFLVARAAAPWLKRSEWGRIVNLGSTIGHGPFRADVPYAPSKGAVAPLTRYLAAVLGPEITVNCVAPGLMVGTIMSGAAPDSFIQSWKDRSVLNDTAAIEDVTGQVMAFLRSSTVTGQVLIVDGGVHFR